LKSIIISISLRSVWQAELFQATMN
jgi:hypothetical protein